MAIDSRASVEDLVAASAAVLGVEPQSLRVVFSDASPPSRRTLDSIGMRDGAIYQVVQAQRPPELESPVAVVVGSPVESLGVEAHRPPKVARDWSACVRAIQFVSGVACLMVPFVVLALSCYGIIQYDRAGCRQPVCTAGGVLQCCTADEFDSACVARPDLHDLGCAAWQRADRPCEQYKCEYRKGTEVRLKDARDAEFEAWPESIRQMCQVGIAFGVCCSLAVIWGVSWQVCGRD